MKDIVYVTGNKQKAKHFMSIMNMDIPHQAVDIEELQSLDIREVVEHKAREAYKQVGKPVIVEDTRLEFHALGRLPGTFIKWFQEELGYEGLCRLIDGKSRSSTAGAAFAYYDGTDMHVFESEVAGEILDRPSLKESNFGWNVIFRPNGSEISFAEMKEEEFRMWYLRVKPFEKLKEFLEQREGVR
jgi:non-canonical purine NTP pyrophosphatase (RdgB/HAM1 family)